MKIGNFTNVFQVNNKRNNSNSVNNASYPNLAPAKKDTVSFGCTNKLLTISNFLDSSRQLSKLPEEFFKALGITVEKDKEGFLALSHFDINQFFKFNGVSDLNELAQGAFLSNLFKTVKIIKGDANFRKAPMPKLRHLELIGGNATFSESLISDLSKLKKIGGDAEFENCGNRKHFFFLDNLESIEGDAKFIEVSNMVTPKLKRIGGDAEFGTYGKRYNNFNLPSLESIEGDALFGQTHNTFIPKLKRIGGNATLVWTGDFPALETIGGSVYPSCPGSFPKLKSIGGDVDFSHMFLGRFPTLESIRGNADFHCSDGTLPKLKSIEGKVVFYNPRINDYEDQSIRRILPNIESIGGKKV